MLFWFSLLDTAKADRIVDNLAGPQHEYKIVLGAGLLTAVFAFVAAIHGSKWWYFVVGLSLGTLGFFTVALFS